MIPTTMEEPVVLPLAAEDKDILLRAVAMTHTDVASFIRQSALRAAQAVIDQNETVVTLSPRDSRRVLELLEHPPRPNASLLAAAQALPPLP